MSRYFAFSGGGWNTHTISSAIVSGTVKAVRDNSADNKTNSFGLSELFAEQAGAGGTSGGSWFLTQLAYSPSFASDLESDPLNWFQSGYMAQQRDIFIDTEGLSLTNKLRQVFEDTLNGPSNPFRSEIAKIPVLGSYVNDINDSITSSILEVLFGTAGLVIDLIAGPTFNNQYGYIPKLIALTKDRDWMLSVKDVVYNSYGMNIDLNKQLGSGRNIWAKDLDLLYGATLPLQETIWNADLLTSLYSSVVSAESTSKYLSPATIVDDSGSNPEIVFLGSDKVQTYSSNSLFNQSTTSLLPKQLPSNLSIIEAAAISGAFAATMSLPSTFEILTVDLIEKIRSDLYEWNPLKDILVLGDGIKDGIDLFLDIVRPQISALSDQINPILSNALKDLAIPVSLDSSVSYFKGSEQPDFPEQISKRATRLFDGGYTDNTTVSNIIADIQKNNMTDDFDVTAFINADSNSAILTEVFGDNNTSVPQDLLDLFGSSTDNMISEKMAGNMTAYPRIFDINDLDGERPIWSVNQDGLSLSYYKIETKTIDNPYYDVTAGQSGTLHAFLSIAEDSGPGPFFSNAFDRYEKEFNQTIEAYTNLGGFSYVLDALGVLDLEKSGKAEFNLNAPAEYDGGFIITYDSALPGAHLVVNSKAENDFAVYEGTLAAYGATAASKLDKSALKRSISRKIPAVSKGRIENSSIFANLKNEDTLVFSIANPNHSQKLIRKFNSEIKETDNGFQVLFTDKYNNFIGSASLNHVNTSDEFEDLLMHDDFRDESSDTYFVFEEETSVNVELRGKLAGRDVFMIELDLDPVTGALMHRSHHQDSNKFEDSIRDSITNMDNSVWCISQASRQISAQADTVLAPVVIDKSKNMITLNLGDDKAPRTRLYGETQVGFELGDRPKPYWDYDDLIVAVDYMN